jgi:hypothetical protein
LKKVIKLLLHIINKYKIYHVFQNFQKKNFLNVVTFEYTQGKKSCFSLAPQITTTIQFDQLGFANGLLH